ncbi:uncharacterized protein LOC143554701 isoform X2 [Bidens hawaiensis]|uniref:uncharacterized protein LOC143554701 isoform X2 n=1 Tax=Bidens hawaiensis TaxID=980011 RepID=UPI00404A8142
MDYHSLKRKELQALCKEHNIPANSANSVLADKLSALFNEKPKQKTRQRTCMKSPAETADEGELAELKRQAKKVRFSPNNDLVEYEQRPGEKQKDVVTQTKTRRKSMAKKVDDNDPTVELNDDSEQIPVKVTRSRVQSSAKEVVSTNNEKKKGRRGAKNVEKETVVDEETEVNVGKVTRSKAKGGTTIDDNNTAVELNDDSGQIPVKVTRSRVQSSAKEVVSTNNQKKKGRRGAKDVEKETVVDKETEVNVGKVTRSKVKEVNEETETVEGTVAARVRVTRCKAQTLMEGGTVSDANPEKKSGKQVKSVEQNVEPSDVPVRATRSRRQTIKEDIENKVTNNTQTDKKRTRREMKATDSSNNSSDVALVDKQETRKRKLFRTRGAETVVEDESDKKEMANKSRVTRSKAPLAKETSGRNKNKASKVEIQQPVETLKHEGKNNVNRRKSVLQTEKVEEAVNHPTRTNTRRKSVVQKASKTVESPTVGKNQSKGLSGSFEDKEVTNGTPRSLKQRQTPIKEDRIIESPKCSTRSASRSEGKFVAETPKSSKRRTPIIEDPIIEKSPKSSTRSASRSEGKSVAETPKSRQRRASIIEDSIIDKSPKNSTHSASRSEGKSVAESPKSRKRKGTPIIEDPFIEKSTKSSTRSASKSEGKSVAKKQVESSFKKPMSKGRSSAIRSGAIVRDSRSKKKAKLSEAKQTDSEDHIANSGKEWTPVAKMKNLKLDEEVNEAEVTPAIDKSGRRFTRSTIKGQPIAEAQLFSPKAAQFRHDSAVNTAPGRITRRGVKHDGNAAGSFSEAVKMKQTRQSAHKKPLHDAEVATPKVTEAGPTTGVGNIEVQSEVKQPDAQVQMSSPEVAEAGLTSDVGTTGDQAEVKQPLDEVQTSAPEVAEVVVNPDVDTVGVQSEVKQPLDDVQLSSPEVSEVQASSDGDTIAEVKQPLDDVQMSAPEVVEAVVNPDVDTVGVQSEVKQPLDDVQMGSPEVAEVQPNSDDDTIAEVKQPLDEVRMTAPEVAEVGVSPDVDPIGVLSEVEEPLDDVQIRSPEVAEVQPNTDGDTIADVKQPLDEVQMSAPEVAEVGVNPDVNTIGVQSEVEEPLDDIQMNSPEVAEVQPNSDGDTIGVGSEISKEVTGQILGDLSASESTRLPTIVVEENIVSVEENASVEVMEDAGTGQTLGDLSASESPRLPTIVTEENASGEVMEDAGACNEKSMTENLSSEKQQNPLESQNLDAETSLGENLSHVKMTPVPMADTAETVPVQNQNDEGYLESELLTEAVNLETSALKSERPDAREKEMHSTELRSSLKGLQNDVMIEEPLVSVGKTVVVEEAVDNNCDSSVQFFSADRHDVADEGEQYDDDESASAQKTLMPEPDSGNRVDVQENPFSGNGGGECDNAVSDRKPHVDMLGTPMIGKGDVQDADINQPQDLETGSELPNANKNVDIDIERVLDDDNNVQDGESEHNQTTNNDSLSERNQLASNDSLAIDVDVEDDNSMPAQNASVPLADEVLVKSCEQEPDVLCDGESDLVMSKDAPEGDTILSVDALDESVVDKNKDAVSSMLSDTDDMDNEGDDENKQNLFEFDEGFQPNESKGISSDVRIEQTKVEVETSRGNDLTLDDKQAATTYDDLDTDEFKEGGSHIKAHEDPTREEASPISYTKGESTIVGVNSNQLMGDFDAHESLITQESFQMAYKKGESLVNDAESDILTIMENARTKQDEPRSFGTSVDWGDYDLAMDELDEPVSAKGGADAEGKSKRDVQDSDFQASASTSSIEDSSGLAACLTNSVRKLEKDSRNADDGNSDQDNILKEYSNSADMTDDFNWSGTPFKSMFKTPGATRTNNTGDSQDDATKLANQDNYSSLKSLFTTPGTSKTSHINDNKSDVVNSTFSDSRGNEDIGSSRTEVHQFNHQWDNSLSKDFGGVTQGDAVRDTSFDDYSEFFEDEVEGSFETKQPEFSNVAAETSHHVSGSKDNSTCQFEKEVTQMKVPKADDELTFDTGHA